MLFVVLDVTTNILYVEDRLVVYWKFYDGYVFWATRVKHAFYF